MKRAIALQLLCVLFVRLSGAMAQTPPPTKYSLRRNGFVSGENPVFHFTGDVLSIQHGNKRSGWPVVTDWYVYERGVWQAASTPSVVSRLPIVHLGACDPGDSIDLASRFPSFVRVLSPGSVIKYVGSTTGSNATALVISSRPAPGTQTGSLLQISLIREGEIAAVVSAMDMGEAAFCRAQWDEHRDGTRNLVVFTQLPVASSDAYAFQSFVVREE